MFTDYKNNDYTNLSDTLDAIYTQAAADKLDYNLYVNVKQGTVVPVSYTHLTLPTILLV